MAVTIDGDYDPFFSEEDYHLYSMKPNFDTRLFKKYNPCIAGVHFSPVKERAPKSETPEDPDSKTSATADSATNIISKKVPKTPIATVPLHNSFEKYKSALWNLQNAKPLFAYPRYSCLTHNQQTQYLELWTKYVARTASQPRYCMKAELLDKQTFRRLQMMVTTEQQQFMQFAEHVARNSQADYEHLHPFVQEHAMEFWKCQAKRALLLGQYYSVHQTISIAPASTSPADPVLAFVDRLLVLGQPSMIDESTIEGKLHRNLTASHNAFKQNNLADNRASQELCHDANVIKLAAKYKANIIITSVALATLADNHSPGFTANWQMPVRVTVTRVPGTDALVTMLYISDPFTRLSYRYEASSIFHTAALGDLLTQDQSSPRRDQTHGARETEVADLSGQVDLSELETFATPDRNPRGCSVKSAPTSDKILTPSAECIGPSLSSDSECDLVIASPTQESPSRKDSVAGDQASGSESLTDEAEAFNSKSENRVKEGTETRPDSEGNVSGRLRKLSASETSVEASPRRSNRIRKLRDDSSQVDAKRKAPIPDELNQGAQPHKSSRVSDLTAPTSVSAGQESEIVDPPESSLPGNLRTKLVDTPESLSHPDNDGDATTNQKPSAIRPAENVEDISVKTESFPTREPPSASLEERRDASIPAPKQPKHPAKLEGSTIESILKLQENLHHKSPGRSSVPGPPPSSKPCAEDESGYQPPDTGCVDYSLWRFGRHTIIVRSGIDAVVKSDDRPDQVASIASKLEYQPHFGHERASVSELTKLWMNLLLRPMSKVIQGRVNALTSDLMMIEHFDLKSPVWEEQPFQPARCMKTMMQVLEKLLTLQAGHYLLSHNPGDMHACIFKSENPETAKRSYYDLHQTYTKQPMGQACPPRQLPWLPLDTRLMLPSHMTMGRVPSTFPPSLKPNPPTMQHRQGLPNMAPSMKKKKNKGKKHNPK